MPKTPPQTNSFSQSNLFLSTKPIALHKNHFQTPYPLSLKKLTIYFKKDQYSSACYNLMTHWAELMQDQIKDNPHLLTNEIIQQTYIQAQKKVPNTSYMMAELCKNYLAKFWQYGLEFANCLKADTDYVHQERNKTQKEERQLQENMSLFSSNLKYIVFDWEGTLTEKVNGQYQLQEEVPQLLQSLKKAFPHVYLILSSKKEHPQLQKEAEHFKVASFFNRICGGTPHKGANKPFFIAWERTMNDLPVSASFKKRQKEILYIGDDKRVDEPFAHSFGASSLIIDRTGNIPTLGYLQEAIDDIHHIRPLCKHRSTQNKASILKLNNQLRRKQ